ncbi:MULTISPECIES: preprotein translocase subunit YajC [Anaerostipes]|uniref:preprotein translocase subunit YajC n=1 Tax=Anaerostipes TaxID=207244 RepID=UPI000951D5C8|nr:MULTISPECIES: preprotein translocase subunit YajC [Anaerostipes]MCI5622952.1 preprotein translocase subunit YajC [Anaerostipes sp.]MDY2727302.1 preprotein translocase subunit YajC [Anaerostipes faecalis]OLR58922.1 preprotein translocase subunit YajC [Anaerostipes sp. 494a]
MNGTGSTILMLVLLFGMMYFLMIRPQKKQEQEKKELMGSLEVGDSVLTVSGFYGVIVDTVDDSTIIVEFGNDKHCRIPMEKAAISAVEKANAQQEEA